MRRNRGIDAVGQSIITLSKTQRMFKSYVFLGFTSLPDLEDPGQHKSDTIVISAEYYTKFKTYAKHTLPQLLLVAQLL